MKMTLGTGIFVSTVLLIFVCVIWQITTRKKWKAIGKAFGSFVVACVIFGAAFYGWHSYKNAPPVGSTIPRFTGTGTQDDPYTLVQTAEDAMDASKRGDYETALNILTPLALEGDVAAQNNLGFHYERGWGVELDYVEAARWYRLAADQGDMAGQYNLGTLYENGFGVQQDDVEATRYYRLSALQGFSYAHNNLGISYQLGRGVTQDDAEAAKWFHLAALQGVPEAQFAIGVSYANGTGVPQNNVQAIKWLGLASSSFVSEELERAVRNSLAIAAEMTPQELEQAQELRRLCLESNYLQCD